MKKTLLALLCAMLIATPLVSTQAETGNLVAVSLTQKVENKLVSAFGPRLKVREVAQVAGGQLLEVTLSDGTVMHMTPDIEHFLYRDELYGFKAGGAENITQSRLNPRRASKLAAVNDKDTVIFPADGKQKALVNVFTDIDCGYCQKLHREIKQLNELGVTVRYLAYPRAGIKDPQTGKETSSYQKINYVWCEAEGKRRTAMTAMKTTQRELSILGQRMRQGADEDTKKEFGTLRDKMTSMMNKHKDCNAPIAAQYNLGVELGVTGTPAIVTQDGTLFPGYLPADELARRLKIK